MKIDGANEEADGRVPETLYVRLQILVLLQLAFSPLVEVSELLLQFALFVLELKQQRK